MKPVFSTRLGHLCQADCLDLLAETPDETFALVFADPPFNLGKKYPSRISDSLGNEEYLAWCESWIKECIRTLASGGAFWLFNLPRWNVELGHFLGAAGLTFRHWIAVNITYGPPVTGRLYPAHYSLLYYTKGVPRVFRRPKIPVPVCRHCGGDIKDYGGHRKEIPPEGLNVSDVWNDIPHVSHRKMKWSTANELSVRLLRRVLEISTGPGDLVFDPFGGSGTTYAVAEEMGRRWLGCEIGDTGPVIRRLSGAGPGVPPVLRGDAGKGMAKAGGTGSRGVTSPS